MAAASVGAALFASSAAAQAATGDAIKGFLDVTAHGAKGDGVTDDAPAIQAAITSAGEFGGVVWFPPGVYLLKSGLIVNNRVMLAGAGWGPPVWEPNMPSAKPFSLSSGSNLSVTSTDFVPLTIKGRGTMVQNIAFYHKQPEPKLGWTPAPYPAAIKIEAHDVRLENIYLHNPTIGILGEDVERLTINRLWGHPIQVGISIDKTEDVVKIDNIEFFPFWTGDDHVQTYVNTKGIAIASYRNDNPHFSNIFAFGYNTGFLFGQSTAGMTSRFHLVNIDLDLTQTGIVLEGFGASGQLSNFSCMGADRVTDHARIGIHVKGDYAQLQGTNLRIDQAGTNAIRAEGHHCVVMLENVVIEVWDINKTGAPAIEAAVVDATIFVGFCRWIVGTSGPLTGGVGTIHLDG